jgi:hypothetical protein
MNVEMREMRKILESVERCVAHQSVPQVEPPQVPQLLRIRQHRTVVLGPPKLG